MDMPFPRRSSHVDRGFKLEMMIAAKSTDKAAMKKTTKPSKERWRCSEVMRKVYVEMHWRELLANGFHRWEFTG